MNQGLNMLSKADLVEGQGVLSATLEQIRLVEEGLKDTLNVTVNGWKRTTLQHYHTLNIEYYLSLPFVKRKGKTICSVHFLPETVENSLKMPKILRKIFYWYMISFYKKMDHLVVVNPYFIHLLDQYGVKKEKVTYIPNFVSEEDFHPLSQEDKKKGRKAYGFKEEDFIVLSVGQLQTRKGVFDFIQLAKNMPEIQFVWAGGFSFGPMTDGYQEIKKIMENPPKNVTFLGIVKREKMNEIFNLADVMALLSFEELFPMTVLESMNCKLPILLRDLEIYEDILQDFYLKEKDLQGFQNILSKLQKDKEFYNEGAERAWKGHEFYSKQHVLKLWGQFYEKVIKE